MTRALKPQLILATLAAAAGFPLGAVAGGTVQVSFVEPQRYTDLGRNARESQALVQALERHVRQLADRHLPDGRSLNIEVLDVDRAGEVKPARDGGDWVRVVRGTADWPRIVLNFTLRDGERVLAQGQETLQAMDYLRAGAGDSSADELRHEKRLLDQWFSKRLPELLKSG